MHPRLRKFVLLAVSGTLSAGFLPSARSADLPSAVTIEAFEVSNPNAEQRAEIRQLRQTLAGRQMATSNIRVYVVPEADGPTTYVTRSPERFRIRPVGNGAYQVVPRAEAARRNVRFATAAGAMDTSGWTRNDHDCFRVSKRWFARWVCWQIDTQARDNDPRRTFWQFKQEATGSANRGWKMKRLWVEGKPVTRARMRFDGIPQPKDSIPKQDRCKKETEALSISVASGMPVSAGFSHSWERVTCEEYEVKHYDDHAHWAVIWKGEPVNETQARNVVFVMPVSTSEGGRPAWEPWSGQHRD